MKINSTPDRRYAVREAISCILEEENMPAAKNETLQEWLGTNVIFPETFFLGAPELEYLKANTETVVEILSDDSDLSLEALDVANTPEIESTWGTLEIMYFLRKVIREKLGYESVESEIITSIHDSWQKDHSSLSYGGYTAEDMKTIKSESARLTRTLAHEYSPETLERVYRLLALYKSYKSTSNLDDRYLTSKYIACIPRKIHSTLKRASCVLRAEISRRESLNA